MRVRDSARLPCRLSALDDIACPQRRWCFRAQRIPIPLQALELHAPESRYRISILPVEPVKTADLTGGFRVANWPERSHDIARARDGEGSGLSTMSRFGCPDGRSSAWLARVVVARRQPASWLPGYSGLAVGRSDLKAKTSGRWTQKLLGDIAPPSS